ncbi:MAG: hypothetical protein JW785_09705 [Acidimicrobiia bacterium]|nr:hypothetical protein [Acidimicrobiia bacterium]
MSQQEGTSDWFHSGGGVDPLRDVTGRRWHMLSVLLSRRRLELERLRKRVQGLLGEIAELEALRRELVVPASREPAGGGSAPGEPFWSPRPILGFRTWQPTRQGMRGVVQFWPKPRLEAFCPHGPGVPHDSPGCRCGIYASKEAATLAGVPWGAWPRPLVHGLVALTGKVVEHERGYRAQRAEVRAAVLLRPEGTVWGSEPAWIEALFTSREGPAGFGGAGSGPMRGRDPLRWAAEYLDGEARRLQEAWTSENRSG